jgi:hypothetical protein
MSSGAAPVYFAVNATSSSWAGPLFLATTASWYAREALT